MATHTSTLSNITRWRGEFAKAMADLQGDSEPQQWSDVYVPQGHLKAIHPQIMLVEGMRGAGKSFWTKVLSETSLRKNLATSTTEPWLQSELERVTDCKAILWDATQTNDHLRRPDPLTVMQWLDGSSFEPKILWQLVILMQFPIDPRLGLPADDPFDPWKNRMEWAQKNPARLHTALQLLDQALVLKSEMILVVIDGIDRVSSRFADTQKLMRGLFQILLDFRYAKGLRLKVFVREDILTHAATTVSDASKLMNEKVTLDWSQQDLFGLAFHYLAQKAPAFRIRHGMVTQVSWKQVNGKYENSNLLDTKSQEQFWIWLAGSYMGGTATKGHTYTWIGKHLADGKGRISPRTFLSAIKEALTESVKSHSTHMHILHHEAIRQGVRVASSNRVQELDNEYVWVRSAIQTIKTANKTVPMDWLDLRTLWRNSKPGVVQQIESKHMFANALIPWDESIGMDEKIATLRDTMENIGVIQIRQRSGQERVDLPDIYRLAYKIGRAGGIAVVKKIKI
jgi:hypothetical protein